MDLNTLLKYPSVYEIDLDILEAVQGGGGGGTGIPEAPKDGSTYGRKDGTWAKVEGGAGKEVIYLDNDMDMTELYDKCANAVEAAGGDIKAIYGVLAGYEIYATLEGGLETLSDARWMTVYNGTTGLRMTFVDIEGRLGIWDIGDNKIVQLVGAPAMVNDGGGSSKEIIYLNGRSQEEYVELFNRLRPEMLAGNFHNYEFYWQITGESSVDRTILMTDVDVSQENWLVFGGMMVAFESKRIYAAIQNDGVCYYEATPLA